MRTGSKGAEDFLDDGIWEDFLDDIFNIKDIIQELGRATEENNQIRDQVNLIKQTADIKASNFGDKVSISSTFYSQLFDSKVFFCSFYLTDVCV